MKPQSVTIKDWLIRKLAVDLTIPERVVENVVTHQFENALEAMKENDSIEFSGWGKFYFKRQRAEWKMAKFLQQKQWYEGIVAEEDVSPKKKRSAELKLRTANINIEALKPKLDGHK